MCILSRETSFDILILASVLSRGEFLNERICSYWIKFFPLIVNHVFEGFRRSEKLTGSQAPRFSPLINVKMPTIVGILTFMSRKNSVLGLYEPEEC